MYVYIHMSSSVQAQNNFMVNYIKGWGDGSMAKTLATQT